MSHLNKEHKSYYFSCNYVGNKITNRLFSEYFLVCTQYHWNFFACSMGRKKLTAFQVLTAVQEVEVKG